MNQFSSKDSSGFAPSEAVFLYWYPDSIIIQMIPIGILSRNGEFEFRYVGGVHRAIELGFILPPEFPETDRAYRSKQLFAIF